MVFDGTVRSVSSGHRESDPFVTTYYPSATTDAAAQPVRVGGQDVSGIDIMLRRAERFAVSGTILDSQGAPASTRVVLVRGGSTSLPNIGFTSVPTIPFTSDSNGRFRFPAALEAGTYRLLVGSGLWPGLTSVNGRTEFADLPVHRRRRSDRSVGRDATGNRVGRPHGVCGRAAGLSAADQDRVPPAGQRGGNSGSPGDDGRRRGAFSEVTCSVPSWYACRRCRAGGSSRP